MRHIVGFAVLLVSAPAAAEVVGSSANGFEISHTVNLVVKPEVASAAFGNVAAWWNADQTYSGNAKNLAMALSPGGCFCERFPDGGGIEHMRVTYVDPNKRVVLTGSLGPLLFEATSGVMDVQVKSRGGGSQLILNYRAAGFHKGGAAATAPIVDKVLGEQLRRYRAFVTAQPRS